MFLGTGARAAATQRTPTEPATRVVFGFVALFIVLMLGRARAFGQNPAQAAENLLLKARMATANGQWEQAVASYQKAVEFTPRDTNLRVELGAVLMKSDRLTDAIASYVEALRISRRNLPAEMGLAQAFRSVHNYDETRRVLERAHREHPGSVAPLAALGDLEIELQTYEAAIGHLSAAVALDAADAKTRSFLAAAYKAKGDQENALAQLAKVLARDPKNALAYFLRAEIYSVRDEDAKALSNAEKAVELQPENPRARMLLGKILLRAPEEALPTAVAERCGKAVEALQLLVRTQPNDPETLLLLSRAYRCTGQEEQAKKTLAAFEAASRNEQTTKQDQHEAQHLVERANNFAMKNDFPNALDLLQQALTKDPSFGPAYSQLAKLYYSAGNTEKASEAIAKALALEPYAPDFLYVQGKILAREGKLDEALASFERTTLVNPKESDAYFEMGMIYLQRHDRSRALVAYQKAAELSPDDPDYRRALAALSAGATAFPKTP